MCVGGLICNAECTEWEDEEERWDREAGAERGRDGFRRKIVRKTAAGERNATHVRELKSHTNLLYLETHTHTDSQTNSVAVCPRRVRVEHYSSHYNYPSLFCFSLYLCLSDKHTERHLHTKHFFFNDFWADKFTHCQFTLQHRVKIWADTVGLSTGQGISDISEGYFRKENLRFD